MDLSLTSDYARGTGDPSPYLRRIAEGGFTHVHWCHQWNTDFLYSRWEVDRIAGWLAEYGLKLLDLHGSVGPEKNWASPREYERLAGVELAANRVKMAARLGGEVVIMHPPGAPGCAPFLRSLAELEGVCRGCGVRIALENGDFGVIREALSKFAPGFLGLCYDCGHGNMAPDGLDALDSLRDRREAVLGGRERGVGVVVQDEDRACPSIHEHAPVRGRLVVREIPDDLQRPPRLPCVGAALEDEVNVVRRIARLVHARVAHGQQRPLVGHHARRDAVLGDVVLSGHVNVGLLEERRGHGHSPERKDHHCCGKHAA